MMVASIAFSTPLIITIASRYTGGTLKNALMSGRASSPSTNIMEEEDEEEEEEEEDTSKFVEMVMRCEAISLRLRSLSFFFLLFLPPRSEKYTSK
jgi:quinol-cytochrome oxidoreductase complex cytochrome b subunit